MMRDGKQWRPFVHVKDTSRAFMKVLESDQELVNGETFNVGSDEQNFRIIDMARSIAKELHMNFKHEWYGMVDNRSYRVSFSKISNVLGYKTKYTLSNGAREIFAALKDNRVGTDDRTITVKWYKYLIETQKQMKEIEINGKIL